MKHLIQSLKNGKIELIDTPLPKVGPGELLIQSRFSLISSGTEKMLIDFGKSNLLNKVRQQPEKVATVISKVKQDGLLPTVEAVSNKLNSPIPLGYSNSGIVIDIGKNVSNFSIGDRVVNNGNHSEINKVPQNLCARIPDEVSDESAAFGVVASIGLQGVRLLDPKIGENIVVMGAGLVGLLTIQILIANGCRVLAIDLDDKRLEIAKSYGAEVSNPSKTENLKDLSDTFSSGYGVDGVVITATSKSNDLISDAAKMSRKRGKIILVGVTGLDLKRDDFYEKEITFQVSCSYGPGRYDINYENKGNDYPIGFVRWTEKRNFEAILEMLRSKLISTDSLISEIVDFEESIGVYEDEEKLRHSIGLLFRYKKNDIADQKTSINLYPNNIKIDKGLIRAGFVGAGNYASRFLIPNFKKSGVFLDTIVTLSGISGSLTGKQNKFQKSSTEINDILLNENINLVVVASQHNSHAQLVEKCLIAGKNVFVEKPLALTIDEIERIRIAYNESQKKAKAQLMVGFNRRFSPHIKKMRDLIKDRNQPLSFIVTVNAGAIDINHWTQDIEIGGGRILGEACHFIDLMRYLVGSEITNVDAKSIRSSLSQSIDDDKASLTLEFKDGSMGTINYFANGSKDFPKERIELFYDGKILQLNNFKKLKGFGLKRFKKMNLFSQNKGQTECIKEFVDSLHNGKNLIDPSEIFEVSEVTVQAAEILRK